MTRPCSLLILSRYPYKKHLFMRKEIIFAIVAGVLFGLVVAFGIWRANTAISTRQETIFTQKTHEVIKKEEKDLIVSVSSFENNDVISESPITITAITKPDTWVVISAEEEDYIIKTDDSGTFNQDIKLTAGLNEILINAYDNQGGVFENILTLVYSTEFFDKEKPAEEKTP